MQVYTYKMGGKDLKQASPPAYKYGILTIKRYNYNIAFTVSSIPFS